MQVSENITKEYLSFLSNTEFPCVAARAAQAKQRAHCLDAGHMECPAHDETILKFLYEFIDLYRSSGEPFYSAAVIFSGPDTRTDQEFDNLVWRKLSSLAALDRKNGYHHDPRVNSDPASAQFAFSLKEEAFFIVGLHPGSDRRSRRFTYPALVFNPHAEFEKLRAQGRYEKMKAIVRARDMQFSGSVNPTLSDFGERSEVFQYTGMQHAPEWTCPLKRYE